MIAVALLAASLSAGCLVLSLHPAYDDQTIAFDEALLGEWRATEDNVQVIVERGEWRSYRIQYKHPVAESVFTAHLTAVENTYYLDLMPLRGVEHGTGLIPTHIILRLTRDGERWHVAAIDYDRARALPGRTARGRVAAALDERHNVVLTGATPAIRSWLRAREERDFSAPATFERVIR
ncbi:MAG: hypothetical protein HYU53_14385 [Acidobacteria bacterium]|nr:hypothetical protein [Acidobacteriota bacterium]